MGQKCGETAMCSLPGRRTLVMPSQSWSSGAFAVMAVGHVGALTAGRVQNSTWESLTAELSGGSKPVTKLARLAGAGLA